MWQYTNLHVGFSDSTNKNKMFCKQKKKQKKNIVTVWYLQFE